MHISGKSLILLVAILLHSPVQCLAEELLLKCMDATGQKKYFSISKSTQKVNFLSYKGPIIGDFRKTPAHYIFSFPKSKTQASAFAKFSRSDGTIEFETMKAPYLSILWTANCAITQPK